MKKDKGRKTIKQFTSTEAKNSLVFFLHIVASGSGIREGTGQTSQVANLLLQREIKTEKWDSPPLSPRQNPHLAAARSLAPPQGTVSTSSYIPPINVPALSAHLPSVFNGPIFSQPPSVG